MRSGKENIFATRGHFFTAISFVRSFVRWVRSFVEFIHFLEEWGVCHIFFFLFSFRFFFLTEEVRVIEDIEYREGEAGEGE